MINKFACLMYHEIAYPYKHKYYVHPDSFKEQIDWLKSNNFSSIDIRKDYKQLPDKCVLITFDDGHKSNLEAARYLADNGFVAVFYLLKDFSLNNPEYLNEDDIKQISSMGHILGVHGKIHGQWTMMSEEDIVDHLKETTRWIENLTGQTVITCSAPGGQIRARERRIIRQNLPYFKYVRDSFHDYNVLGQTDLHSKGIKIDTGMSEFKKMVQLDQIYYSKARTKCWLKDRAKDLKRIITGKGV